MQNKTRTVAPARPRDSVPTQWHWHFRALRSLRDRLVTDQDSQRKEAGKPQPHESNDLADYAADEFDHEVAFSLLTQEESSLQDMDAALRRIENGTYGVCEETGKAIPAARLRAVPWARYCKEVQERLEREQRKPQPREVGA